MIYLDNAATTYPKPEEVYEANDNLFRNNAFNAGRSSYQVAKQSINIIDETRNKLCTLVKATNCIFTTSVTHAFNILIQGIGIREESIIYISPYEHNAVVRTLKGLQKSVHFTLLEIPITKSYSIDIETFKNMTVIQKPTHVFCNHVSNVTGYILPLEEISSIIKNYNSIFVVDGAQSLGIEHIDIQAMNIDYLCFAGHKTLYGPFGVGGILCKQEPQFDVTYYGGTGTRSLDIDMPTLLPEKFEPSSPNVVAIGTLSKAIDWVQSHDIKAQEHYLITYLCNKLNGIDEVTVYQNGDSNSGIVSIIVAGFDSNDISTILHTDFDICLRGGYHCCPLIHKYLGSIPHNGTIRISVGYFNSTDDIDALIDALEEIIYE